MFQHYKSKVSLFLSVSKPDTDVTVHRHILRYSSVGPALQNVNIYYFPYNCFYFIYFIKIEAVVAKIFFFLQNQLI